MSAPSKQAYAPLNRRHKRIFAVAAVSAVGFCAGVASARFALIQWWLANCPTGSSRCSVADEAITWWWVGLLAGVFAIALVAERLTADRLKLLAPNAPGQDPPQTE